jgi:hypothetical protein
MWHPIFNILKEQEKAEKGAAENMKVRQVFDIAKQIANQVYRIENLAERESETFTRQDMEDMFSVLDNKIEKETAELMRMMSPFWTAEENT